MKLRVGVRNCDDLLPREPGRLLLLRKRHGHVQLRVHDGRLQRIEQLPGRLLTRAL